MQYELSIFIGSPRGKSSNSTILAEKFITGFNSINKIEVPVFYLNQLKNHTDFVEVFKKSQSVILIFPLYTDSMPGIVKSFLEQLPKSNQNKNMGFVVHSGFPEAIHSTFVEKYLDKLSNRLNCNYLGTIIKGGTEGIKIMPEYMTKSVFRLFIDLGKNYAANGELKREILMKLAKPYKFSRFRLIIFRFLSTLGLTNMYWNMNLKKHNAYNLRFAKPYEPQLP